MSIVLRLFLLALIGVPAAATGSPHNAADAIALVDRAGRLLQSGPRDAAFAAFDDPKGAFVDGDLYLYVLDLSDKRLIMLAHGTNHALIGLPQNEVVDAEGRDFNQETVDIVRSKGAGWVTYKWPNPATKKIATKSSYVKLVDGLIIGAGIYQ